MCFYNDNFRKKKIALLNVCCQNDNEVECVPISQNACNSRHISINQDVLENKDIIYLVMVL